MASIYLDTNIILDILDSQRDNHHLATQLLKKIVDEDHKVFISEDILSTIYYVIKNKQAILEFFKLIIKEWNIIPFGEQTISTAIDLCLDNPKQDLEDSLQCLCAKNAGCDLLISRDSSFVDCDFPVMGLAGFLKL